MFGNGNFIQALIEALQRTQQGQAAPAYKQDAQPQPPQVGIAPDARVGERQDRGYEGRRLRWSGGGDAPTQGDGPITGSPPMKPGREAKPQGRQRQLPGWLGAMGSLFH